MKILHPTDFSPASLKALELARYLRGLTGGSLTVLHASEPRYSSPAEFFSPDTERIFEEAERAWSVLTGRKLAALDPDAETALEASKPVPAILSRAERFDLLVMGTHGEDGIFDRLVGSTTERVIAQGRKPVAVVHQSALFDPARGLPHLLAAAGVGEAADRAMALAARVAKATGGKLTLLHVGDDAKFAELQGQAEAVPGAEVKILSTNQPPARALLEYVADSGASALFMGKSRASGLFGSVTRSVLNTAKVPVFVHP